MKLITMVIGNRGFTFFTRLVITRTTLFISLAVILLGIAGREAQATPPEPKVQVGAEYLAPVYPFEFDGDLRDLPIVPAWRPGDPIKEIPKRRRPPTGSSPVKHPTPQPDPLLELQENARRGLADRTFSTPDLNFTGGEFSGVNPPDTVGDVGLNYYIQMVNGISATTFRVYNKSTGAIEAGPISLQSLGSGLCSVGSGDPIVLYDQLADRWLLSEFSGLANALCVYVSKSADPITGGWYLYDLSTPNFPDYPKYAIWPSAYYITSNESSPAVYALDRGAMLTGGAAGMQRFTATSLGGFGFQALTPGDSDGYRPPTTGAPGYLMRHRDDEAHNGGSNDPTRDFLELWEFQPDFSNPANSTFTGPTNIAITEFNSALCGLLAFACFPQPGTSTTLDPLREVVMWRLQYRNFGDHESLVGNLVTDVDDADHGGIRWFELRKVSAEAWTLFQEGTYAPDAHHRWMGSISMDAAGNMAVGYNVSSSTVNPSLRYAGRLASDSAGTLPQGEFVLIAGSSANASNRYGDYSALSVDPGDDCSFWLTGEYNPSSQWSTRVGKFNFDACKADTSCSGTAVVMANTNVASGGFLSCEGTSSIDMTLATVTVQNGGQLNVKAPVVRFGPQFKVENGAIFRTRN